MDRKILAVSAALCLLAAAACGPAPQDLPAQTAPQAPGETATVTLPAQATTPAPTPSHPPTRTPQPSASPSPTPSTVEAANLSPTGPWWVFVTGEGVWADAIWAMNPDGSGLTEFTAPGRHIVRPRDFPAAVSPTGGDLAFITAADQNSLSGLILNVLELPEGEIASITPLSSADTEPAPDADPALRPPEPLLAITQEQSLAWSPDGRVLAFLGAFEGPSSDLYVYGREDGSLTRLTDGPSQAIRPAWSPDGEWILHFGVDTLGTGAGYEMAGAWAARADGTDVKTLYEPAESSGEELVGWVSDDRFVVFSHSQRLGGPSSLRIVDVETGSVEPLWEGAFRGVAMDPDSGNMLVLVDGRAASQNPDMPVGLYLVTSDGATWRVLEDESIQATWSSEAGLFFARTEFGIVAVTANGDWNQLHDFTGRLPVASPVTDELAWYGEAGLWIGNLISTIDEPQPTQVFTGPVRRADWGPEGENVLFFAEDGLYVVGKPDLTAALVAEGLEGLAGAWGAKTGGP